MIIKLSKPFASNGIVDEYDVIQMKKALNRLGYYVPYEKVGITGISDKGIFDALKAFQKDHNLPATGTAKPEDETVDVLNKEASKTPIGQYIWRTVEDDKVRKGHSQYNRTIRNWDDSPDPGEDFNCRCWAEPLIKTAGLRQVVTSPINEAQKKWTWFDFVEHFYRGKGEAVSLSEIGLLSDVIDNAKSIIFGRVEKQIEKLAKLVVNGQVQDTFSRSYFFGNVSFSLGKSTVKGNIRGKVKKQGKILLVDTQVEYFFFDEFTDPLNIRQHRDGSSSSENADAKTEVGGTAYDIVDIWLTEVTGTVTAP